MVLPRRGSATAFPFPSTTTGEGSSESSSEASESVKEILSLGPLEEGPADPGEAQGPATGEAAAKARAAARARAASAAAASGGSSGDWPPCSERSWDNMGGDRAEKGEREVAGGAEKATGGLEGGPHGPGLTSETPCRVA